MSLLIKNYTVDKEKLEAIKNNFTIETSDKYSGIKKYELYKLKINKYDEDTNLYNISLIVPLLYWKSFYKNDEDIIFYNPKQDKTNFTTSIKLITKEKDIEFGGQRDQDNVIYEAITKLNEDRVVLLNLSTGFGKTNIGILLSSMLKKKVLWISPYTIPNEKTYEDFKKLTSARVKLLNSSQDIYLKNSDKKEDIVDLYDVVICGVIMCNDIDISILSKFELLIIDECHAFSEQIYTNLLLKIKPQYLIGLSATPDKGGKMLEKYFGNKKKYISRLIIKNFTVHKYNTKIKLKVEYTTINNNRCIDYDNLVEQIENNIDRCILIAYLAENKYKSNRIIILVNRVKIANDIYDSLKNKNEAELFIETTKRKQLTGKRILIAQRLKAGVGFDDEGLNKEDKNLRYNTLFVTFDTKDIRQNEGRIRENKNLIVEFVDDCELFNSHFQKRYEWYIKRGMTNFEEFDVGIKKYL